MTQRLFVLILAALLINMALAAIGFTGDYLDRLIATCALLIAMNLISELARDEKN